MSLFVLLLESFISKFATCEISIFLPTSVACETGLSLALLENPEDRFVTLRPTYDHFSIICVHMCK